MKLVAGLGNPGRKYEQTRHNLGFRVVDHIAKQNDVTIKKKSGDSLVGGWTLDGEKILLVKPQTYMNRSGEAIRGLLKESRISAQDLVVVYDELDLPFGRIRIRPGGSAGGHRGALSILESLAGAAFFRVRVGIGRPPDGVDPTHFVLDVFTADEAKHLETLVDRAAQAVICLLREGAETAMGRFNRTV